MDPQIVNKYIESKSCQFFVNYLFDGISKSNTNFFQFLWKDNVQHSYLIKHRLNKLTPQGEIYMHMDYLTMRDILREQIPPQKEYNYEFYEALSKKCFCDKNNPQKYFFNFKDKHGKSVNMLIQIEGSEMIRHTHVDTYAVPSSKISIKRIE